MTNKDYETDNSMFECNDAAEFQGFIEEREKASEWKEATIRELKVEATSSFSPKGVISEESRREASFLVKHPHFGILYMRNIAASSLLERARISGYALGELSRDDFAYVVTKCLETAKVNDVTKIRVQEGKAAAFMASSYKIIPQPEIFRQTADHITSQFGGSFSKGVWSHSISLGEYSVSLPVEDYEDIFKSKGMNFSDITMSVSVMTSDTGHSGANIYPSVIGTMPGGRKYRVPILGSICMNHKGKVNIKKFDSNLSLAFSQTEKSKERIRELDAISLNYPFNAFCNILKKVGIVKKQAMDVLNRFAVTIGNDAPATAADVYFKACEITFEFDFVSIYHLKQYESDIIRLSGFGQQAFNKLWSAIEKSRHTTLNRVIAALGIPTIGRSAGRDISEHFGGDAEAFTKAVTSGYDFTVLRDFGQTMQDNLISWFADQNNLAEWENLLKELDIEKPAPKAAVKQPLAGMTIVPTGTLENFTRSGIKTAIEANGGKCGSSVSSRTTYVLVGDKPGSKYTKGKALGIPMITEADFLTMIK